MNPKNKYKCPQCQEAFRYKCNLENHQAIKSHSQFEEPLLIEKEVGTHNSIKAKRFLSKDNVTNSSQNNLLFPFSFLL